jgi:hypothetical protein
VAALIQKHDELRMFDSFFFFFFWYFFFLRG